MDSPRAQVAAIKGDRQAGLTDFPRRLARQASSFVRAHPSGGAAGILLLVLLLVVMLADVIAPFRYDRSIAARFSPPLSDTSTGQKLWLGTDEIGRDLFSRMLHGGRTSLYVGLAAPLLGISLGALIGILSAYFGGVVDLLVQRLVDVILTLPALVMAMVITIGLGFKMSVVIVAIGVSLVAASSRVMRSHALTLREMQYVTASEAIGTSHLRIVLRHLIPNSMAPFLVLFAVNVGNAITTEAALSFLGLGISPPTPSWGNMLTTAQQYFEHAPQIAFVPGLTVAVVVLAVNLLGDSLRDALDPRLRGRV
jgi:peptide/nickel transport system permease protein